MNRHNQKIIYLPQNETPRSLARTPVNQKKDVQMKLVFVIMSATLVTACFIGSHLTISNCCAAESSSSDSPVVTTVLEKRIKAADVGLQCDVNQKPLFPQKTSSAGSPNNPLDELAARIEREVSEDYLEQNHLKATDQEIHEFQQFQERSMARDRIRRQKELAELDKELQDANLSPKEREQAEKTRARLIKSAARDKKLAEAGSVTAAEWREIAGPWIEGWKINQSIYKKYGGAVDMTKFGPNPVEARKRLLEDYQKQGKILIHDVNLRREFWERMGAPPNLPAKPNEIDFTPYWKKPLPKEQE